MDSLCSVISMHKVSAQCRFFPGPTLEGQEEKGSSAFVLSAVCPRWVLPVDSTGKSLRSLPGTLMRGPWYYTPELLAGKAHGSLVVGYCQTAPLDPCLFTLFSSSSAAFCPGQLISQFTSTPPS